MIRAAVAGVAGRMGTRIAQIIGQTEGLKLSGGFEYSAHPSVGSDLAQVIGGSPAGMPVNSSIHDVLDGVDVIIDFTNATVSLEHLRIASKAGKAMVIGSTGFTGEQLQEARELAHTVPCVLTPNMSMGVNIVFKVVENVARMLGDDFDVEIVEAHHRFKKDAPSGTAIKLAEVIAQALGRDLEKTGVYERHGIIGERTPKEIGLQTLRGGDIVGEHTVMFAGLGERIEITHRAHNRDNFARGAVRAAQWVVGKTPQLYDMHDVLGIR